MNEEFSSSPEFRRSRRLFRPFILRSYWSWSSWSDFSLLSIACCTNLSSSYNAAMDQSVMQRISALSSLFCPKTTMSVRVRHYAAHSKRVQSYWNGTHEICASLWPILRFVRESLRRVNCATIWSGQSLLDNASFLGHQTPDLTLVPCANQNCLFATVLQLRSS